HPRPPRDRGRRVARGARQRAHAARLEGYVRAETDISGSTGALLAMLAPLSTLATQIGAQAARGTAVVFEAGGRQLTATTESYVRADMEAHAGLVQLARGLDVDVPPWSDPRADVAALGAAPERAAADHGSVDSW